MRKIIYSKYSNDRSPEFRIRTDILEDEQKNRYVSKTSMDQRSKVHIHRLCQNYNGMKTQFADSRFTLNRLTPTETGVELEYLDAPTLEQILDKMLKNREFDNLLTLIKEYVEELRRTATLDFCPTPEFTDIFGAFQLDLPFKSMKISDVDMIFKNIIVTGDAWQIIDFEWSYGFPIPVDWIIYRTIHYYVSGQRDAILKEHYDLYEEAGISESMCQYFQCMEASFQQYLVRGNRPLGMLFHSIGGTQHFPNEYIECSRLKEIEFNDLMDKMMDKNRQLEQKLEQYQAQSQTYEKLYETVMDSTSWKITKPLRGLTGLFKK